MERYKIQRIHIKIKEKGPSTLHPLAASRLVAAAALRVLCSPPKAARKIERR
jgi:hypothetical protein